MDHIEEVDEIDTTNEDPQYWEDILQKFGLGVETGFRHRHESPRGGISQLVTAEEIEARKSTGKTTPKGFGPPKETSERH